MMYMTRYSDTHELADSINMVSISRVEVRVAGAVITVRPGEGESVNVFWGPESGMGMPEEEVVHIRTGPLGERWADNPSHTMEIDMSHFENLLVHLADGSLAYVAGRGE